MCGIFGFTAQDRDLLKRMASVLAHRGPDDEGFYTDEYVSLGNRRLAIIGVASGHQPLMDESGNVVLVYNGEIYNYCELKHGLQKRGHYFTTDSDGEVIIHLYEERGVDCVQGLRGMFTFALWDTKQKRLILARDRMGIKPLFWTFHDGAIYFASEIKALCQVPAVRRELDPCALEALIALRHVPGFHTIFKGIYTLEPGHIACWRPGRQLEFSRYWTPKIRESYTNFHQEVESFSALLRSAVKEHLMSEVPLGATLSGGVDSSLIVAIMSGLGISDIQTFSIGFGVKDDELAFARHVAEYCRTNHVEFIENPENFIELLPLVLWHMEEPQTGAMLPTWFLARRACRQVKVLLVGEGADELFGGYIRFKTALGPGGWLPPAMGSWAYVRGVNGFTRRETLRLLRTSAPSGCNLLKRYFYPQFEAVGPARRNRLLYYEQRYQLPNLHLMRVDKLTMASSIEARVPYLDHRVVEFANRLPGSWKIRFKGEKLFLRAVAARFLPDSIVQRPKKGLSTPVEIWFGRGLREMAIETLAEAAKGEGYFREKFLRRLFSRVSKRNPLVNYADKLALLLMVEFWHRVFIEPSEFVPLENGALVSPVLVGEGGLRSGL